MYTIIGADGKEYGPVPADTLRDWIAAGRANAQTRIRRQNETEWSTIGAVPELAEAVAPKPPPVATPGTPGAAPGAVLSAEDLVARARPIDITGCLKRGWESGKANFFPVLGVTLLIGLCAGMAGAIPVVGIFASLFLAGVFYGGLYYYILKKVRGEATEIGDAFSGFSVCFGQLALATFVSSLLTVFAFLLLILPGIYLAVCWMFTYLIVREKGLPFWDAMELGRKVITAQWFRVFGVLLLFFLLAVAVNAVPIALAIMGGVMAKSAGAAGAGLIAVGVLGIITMSLLLTPIYMAALMHIYDDLFNPPAN